MLLPTQQTSGLVATNMMRSMLDRIEEQRKQDEAERSGKERDRAAEARVSAGDEAKRAKDKIASALFGSGSADPNKLKTVLVERLAAKLGIDTEEAKSGYKLGIALEDALKSLSSDDVTKLAKDLGLQDLGISMQTLISAIKNPYADDGVRLTEALIKQANGGTVNTDINRLVQRLDTVANPKTLEELKLGPQGSDPTRAEDDQTKAERQEDIKAAEAGKKLDDVQKAQAVVEKSNKADATPAVDGNPAPAGTTPTDMAALTLFAAAAAQVGSADTAVAKEAVVQNKSTQDGGAQGTGVQGGATAQNGSAGNALVAMAGDTTPNAVNAQALDKLASPKATDTKAEILTVHVDDIGIYELFKKNWAA